MPNMDDLRTRKQQGVLFAERQNESTEAKIHPRSRLNADAIQNKNCSNPELNDTTETPTEEVDQYEINVNEFDDEARALYEDDIAQLSSMPETPHIVKADPLLVNSAIEEIRASEFSDETIKTELQKMFSLYQGTVEKALVLSGTVAKYQEMIEQYQDKKQQDNRFKKAMYLVQEHRRNFNEANRKKDGYKQALKDVQLNNMNLVENVEMLKKQFKYKQNENLRLLKAVREMEDTTSKNMKLESTIAELRKELSEVVVVEIGRRETVRNTVRMELGVELERRHERIEKLMGQVEAVSEQRKSFSVANDGYRRHATILEQQIEDLHKTLDTCVKRAKGFKQKKHMMAILVDVLKTNIKKKEVKIRELIVQDEKDKKLIGELTRDAEILRKENYGLAKKAKEVARKHQCLQNQVFYANEEMKKARIDLHGSKTNEAFNEQAIKDLENKISNCGHEVNTCHTRCRNLLTQLNAAITDNSEKDDLLRCSEKNAQLMTIEVHRQTSEALKRETAIRNLASDLSRVHNHMMDLRSTMKHWRDAHGKLVNYMYLLDKLAKKLEDNIVEKKAENSQLRIKNANLFIEGSHQSELIEDMHHQSTIKDNQLDSLAFSERKAEDLVQTLIVKAEFDMQVISSKNKEITLLENELKTMKTDLDMSRLHAQSLEKSFLDKCDELRLTGKQVEQIRKQRDLQAAVSTQRKVELELVEERMRHMERRLGLAFEEYQKKCYDVRVLVIETKNLRKKLAVHGETKKLLLELRTKYQEAVSASHRQKLENAALEKMKQQNIHRWTLLKTTDPSVYELHQKQHHLCKRLIQKTEEVIQKEQIIIQKNKLFLELKTQLSRCYASNTFQELTEAQTELVRKDRQIKALKAELTFSVYSEKQATYMVEEGDKEKQEVKKQYFKEKKINSRLRQKQKKDDKLPPIQPNPPPIRRHGGGFRRSIPTVQKQFVVTGKKTDRPNR